MADRSCKSCGERKSLDQFPAYITRGKRGHRHECRACWNAKWSPIVQAHNKRYYHDNASGYRDKAKARALAYHTRPGEAERHAERNLEYYRRHPERAVARHAVQRAVKAGRLLRSACCVCGVSEDIHAHHEDYSKPLEVMWLCREHHGERHRVINRHGGDPDEWPEDLRVRETPGRELDAEA